MLIRLARRLTKAVASPTDAIKPREGLSQEDAQGLLRDIDYIYKCVGRKDQFEEFLAVFAISIELTRTLPFETHQYFRPRGSAYGFRHTTHRMLKRGAKVPLRPRNSGEAAAFAMALRTRQGFRPRGWQAEIMKWLRGESPYLAELMLDNLPAVVPEDVFAYLPEPQPVSFRVMLFT